MQGQLPRSPTLRQMPGRLSNAATSTLGIRAMEQLATSEFSGATDVWKETLCLEVDPGGGCTLSSRSRAILGHVSEFGFATDEDGFQIVPAEIDGERVWKEGEFVVTAELQPHTDTSEMSFQRFELAEAVKWLRSYGWSGVPQWGAIVRRLRDVLGGNGKSGVTISVTWGNELHSVRLGARNWARVLSGNPVRIRGKGYRYEGDFFWDYWSFGGGFHGTLLVEYGADGGVGFDGRLSAANIEED